MGMLRPPVYVVDDPSDPDYGLWVDAPFNPHSGIAWFEPISQDIYAEAATIQYTTFSSIFIGVDSFAYVATDDRTLTTYSAPATVTIEVFED